MKKTFRSVLCTSLILPIALTGCTFRDGGNGSEENRNAMDGSSENSLENGGISDGGFSGLNGLAIRTAVYPEMAPYPDWMSYINSNGEMDDSFNEAYDAWWEDLKTQRNQPEGYAEGLEGFFKDSIRQFLSGSQGQNRVYSPLNVCMALAATISFHAKWHNEFLESRTEKGVFHGANGDINCDFMHQGGSRTYYWGDQFSAVAQGFENDGGMWFVLPDEGVSVDELLQDEQVMKFILTNEWEDSKYLIVNLSVPKFDVASDMDLVSGLKALGVTDIFDSEVSDFSPMTADTEEIYLSQAMHAARVMIDEEGCTAVAYTVMPVAGAAMPPDEEIDFILDRPFLFVITGSDNLPLFVGVVNQPIDF